MRKIEYFMVFAIIGTVLLSGCVDEKAKQKMSLSDTEPSIVDTSSAPSISDKIIVEGRAVRDGKGYYVIVGIANPTNEPVMIDAIERYFVLGSFEKRSGTIGFINEPNQTIMPGKTLYIDHSISSDQLDLLKKSAWNYNTDMIGFYIRPTYKGKAAGEDAYWVEIPRLAELSEKSNGIDKGYAMKFLPINKPAPGLNIDSFYVEAFMYLPPNSTAGTSQTKDDYDYLVTVKMQYNGNGSIVFDKITTLVDDGGNGLWGKTQPRNGSTYWALTSREPLYFVFSTTGHTRKLLQTAKINNKTELYFSFELSYKDDPLYEVYITPLPFMENLPDPQKISDMGGLPLKLDILDIPKKNR